MTKAKILEGLQYRLGMTPAMMRIISASPAVLGGYQGFLAALANGVLDPKFRERIALAVARANQAEVSIALHSEIAKRIGMSEEEIQASLHCHSDDALEAVALKFVGESAAWRGQFSPEGLNRMRRAGFSDAEIVEIAANAGVVTLANWFECLAGNRAQELR
jgi:AhpD family alkylhydroperoxidase